LSESRRAGLVQNTSVKVVQPEVEIQIVPDAGVEPNPTAEPPVILQKQGEFS
jgi:hypothetical protein